MCPVSVARKGLLCLPSTFYLLQAQNNGQQN